MNDNCSCVGYVIREGDTLYKISKRFRIPLPILLRANLDVNVYNLIPGQKICLPPGMMPPPIMPKEQLEDNLMFANEINATRKHIVGENETLEAVMDMYNVTIEDMFKYNNRNGLVLKEDQMIYMP